MNRLLSLPTTFYQKWPTWLLVPVSFVMVELAFTLGMILHGLILGPLFVLYLTLTQQWDNWSVSNVPLHLELLGFLPVALIFLAWVKWVEKRPLVSLGFFRDKWLKELALGFGLGALQFSLSLGLIWLFGGVQLRDLDLSAPTLAYVVTIIPFWLLQGGTEELATRGWLLPVLRSKTNLAWAIGLSSSLFGIMHLGNDHVTFLSLLNLVLSGVSMALYMLWRDNLWGVVGLHGAWNFVQGNVYGIAVSGTGTGASLLTFSNQPQAAAWLSGGDFGTEGSLMATVVELALIAYLVYRLWQDKVKAQARPVDQLKQGDAQS